MTERKDAAAMLRPEVAAKVAEHYGHAMRKHPHFAHTLEEVVPTCSVARAQRRLELLKAQMSDMVNMPPGTKYHFSPQAVIDEIDDTLATRPRNCDVFADAPWDTISRAWQDWLLETEPNKRKVGSMEEFCCWLIGPAKEAK